VEDTLSRKQINTALFIIAILFVTLSIVVMFKHLTIGLILFMLTLYYINRIRRWHNQANDKSSSDETLKNISRQNSNRGRTIYVQIVDDNGNDLPEAVVQQKLYKARRSAEPRDNIVTVRHKINA
jgi:hypothetical protein